MLAGVLLALGLDGQEVTPAIGGLDLQQRVQPPFQRLDLGDIRREQGDRHGFREGNAETVEGAGEDAGVFLEDPVHRLVG